MDRRGFASKVSGVVAATWLGFVKQSEAHVVDLTKRSKAKIAEEDRITVEILGFNSEEYGMEGEYQAMKWRCKYQVNRIDGTTATKESQYVLATKKHGPPMRYTIDLS